MKIALYISAILIGNTAFSQELFTYTEPASNMATKSIGFRANNRLMRQQSSDRYHYYLSPEVMWGVSKKFMLHAEGFFSNSSNRFDAEGAGIYIKYRFYTQDEVHNHFRLAATGRLSYNKNNYNVASINLNGDNSGYEWGVIATKLVNKIALSAGTSYIYRFNNGSKDGLSSSDKHISAIAYSLSFGKLFLPVEYINYQQVNMNGMLELLGQINLDVKSSVIDIAPSVQFIFLSRMRLDLGYRFPLVNDFREDATEGFLLRFEYTIFNAFK